MADSGAPAKAKAKPRGKTVLVKGKAVVKKGVVKAKPKAKVKAKAARL